MLELQSRAPRSIGFKGRCEGVAGVVTRLVFAAVTLTLAAACDSGGPPAVPSPRVAAPGDLLYLVTYSEAGARVELRSAGEPGRILAVRILEDQAVSLASNGPQLFAAVAPSKDATEDIRLEEWDPLKLITARVIRRVTGDRDAYFAYAGLQLTADGNRAYFQWALGYLHEGERGAIESVSLDDGSVAGVYRLDVPSGSAGTSLRVGKDGLVQVVSRPVNDAGYEASVPTTTAVDPVTLAVRSGPHHAGEDCQGALYGPFEGGVVCERFAEDERRWYLVSLESGAGAVAAVQFPPAEVVESGLWTSGNVLSDDGKTLYWIQPFDFPAVRKISLDPLREAGTLDRLPEIKSIAESGSFDPLGGLSDLVFGWLGGAAGAKPAVWITGTTSADGRHLFFTGVRRAETDGGEGRLVADGVWMLDAEAMTVTRHLAAGHPLPGSLRLSPDGERLYAIGAGVLVAVSTSTGEVLFETGIPGGDYYASIDGFAGVPFGPEG